VGLQAVYEVIMSATILVVDDEESILKSLGGILEDEGYKPLYAGDGIEALAVVQREVPDLVLLDIWMPRMEGLETLQRLKEIRPGLIVVMMSGHGTIETAVKSTKMGAYDFIEKPLSLEKVVLTVRKALGLNRLQQENASLRSLVLQDHDLVGSSPSVVMLREQIQLVAPTDSTVLLSGENGTGKELAARSIHLNSLRSDKPFIEINCAAIPEDLIEQELVGHEKGALPGAFTQKKGASWTWWRGGRSFSTR
jgi:two-component system nitrogen regulation response regulator NtrX